jgi:hypothetical protein
MCKNDCILYCGAKYEDLRNALFVNLIDSIIEKMVLMMRITIEEKAGIKMCFGMFLSFLV